MKEKLLVVIYIIGIINYLHYLHHKLFWVCKKIVSTSYIVEILIQNFSPINHDVYDGLSPFWACLYINTLFFVI